MGVEQLAAIFGDYAQPVLALLGLFAALAVFVPAPQAGAGWLHRSAYTVLNWLACNVGKAANADDREDAKNPKEAKDVRENNKSLRLG